ncbi:unnamed protein product [Mytilus coruscus]|uniref:Reverse transcriptase domain-containing protein n=1 Tax=Mytilus coruscus TaxID=42192 RepID=A0A6J8EVZ4_MYTCO|nr:unnamed protein product [Mytilus coruscus]
MSFTPGAYELYKQAIYDYYESNPTRIYEKTTKASKTNNGLVDKAIVEESLSIRDGCTGKRRQLFRINLFNTTRRMDVYGMQYENFICHDLPIIIDTVKIDNNALPNQIYLTHVLNNCDILFKQEHWLFSFEKHKLQDNNSTHICCAKSVDDNIDTEILVKGRGYGGVAAYWRQELDNSIRYIQDGNERMIVLSFNVIGTPFCFIGVYMPSENKTVMNNTKTRLCNWKRCDKETFKNSIRESVKDMAHNYLFNTPGAVKNLSNILHTAGKDSIHNYHKSVSIKSVGKGIWNKKISEASKTSKCAFYQWKNDKTNTTTKNKMRSTRKTLRSTHRRVHASRRNSLMEKIMRSSQRDTKLFHKLVRQQRNKKTMTTDTMVFNGEEQCENEQLLNGWKGHFEKLYKHSETDIQKLNCEKLNLVILQNDIIKELETNKNEKIENTNQEEVQNILKKLKSGKSHGPDGLSAEHFKYMPDELLPFLIDIINSVFEDKEYLVRINYILKTTGELQLQTSCLPTQTANTATYVMLGMKPIQAVVDRILLTFSGGIFQDKCSIEFKIIERHVVMAKEQSNSFINRLRTVLAKYELPKAEKLIETAPTKMKWKTTVKHAIGKFWEA